MLKNVGTILRPALVLLLVFFFIGMAGIAYQSVRTLQRLTAVEAVRDQWQRPDDIVRTLDLKPGDDVVDFGSGAGYFTLKLSDVVGRSGQVIAVDLRRISLFFLRIRAFLDRKPNIRIIVGDPDDPHLAGQSVDAVLIVNTYHELADPPSILRHLSGALRPGGRLVVVDQRPPPNEASQGVEHYVPPERVDADLRAEGFEIKSRDDSFIVAPETDLWWMIVAIKHSP